MFASLSLSLNPAQEISRTVFVVVRGSGCLVDSEGQGRFRLMAMLDRWGLFGNDGG